MTPVGELIAERIRTSGPISFAEFMELSLYHPEFGYYARAAQRTGRAGDFFTSVDVGSVFGELLAKQFAEMWRLLGTPAFDLVEAAAGNGRLARDVLDAASVHHPDFYSALRVALVERSPTARAAQMDALGPHARLLTRSSAKLPDRLTGVIFANELLDALPTHAVAMTDSGLREIFIDVRDGLFVECASEPSTPELAAYLARAGATLAVGWRAEVDLAAEHWIRNAARSLDRGFLLIVDYGHEERDLYGSSHSTGTLTMFHRHTTDAGLQEPGSCDITAHVDLSAVQRAALDEGMTLLGCMDQTYFMLGLGFQELADLEASPGGADEFGRTALHRRLAMKTLMLPGGLGSTHKVLVFGKGVGTPELLCASRGQRLT